MSANILLVEDEPAIADALVFALQRDGFRVSHCLTGQAALLAAQARRFDLLILDVGLPDQTGFELCRALRAIQPTPVLFLTARNEEVDRIVGLELGAEDYVGKPFSPRELILRIKVILRRHAEPMAASPAPAPDDEWIHEPTRAAIRFRQHDLPLTRSEYLLLACLLAQPGRVFSREQLLAALGPQSEDSTDRVIDTLIKQLRAKLRAVDSAADPIITHRGFGYSLKRSS
ncbi:two-component system response regulator CreB [Permianibacter sp. IMCC34836]|uniref:two-component system response regulator CreB n=1 Tax=Permianibacter fluminis TaxID=2738515 RepID=UPI00155646D0|nr:two-component system response regulator CreB [Permianibacter fluminis]NQD36394.1 two-component system response regulator CreB [Permianibacter fluminis]